MSVELGAQQQAALNRLDEWWNRGGIEPFRLFGAAGTGKTWLAQQIPAALGVPADRVRYAAFSGKAADVLRRKGCRPVSTVHGLIYRPAEDTATARRQHLREQLRRDDLSGMERSAYQFELNELRETSARFERREVLGDEDSPEPKLIILDEVSMIGDEIARDLLAFDIPLIVLGDPYQLPPVSGAGYFDHGTPDVLLTDVHRQALDSPVLALATRLRTDPTTAYPVAATVPQALAGELFGQVLVWRNKTRWDVITRLRRGRGRPDGVPVPGDRVICLTNNRKAGLFNGGQFTVLDADGAHLDLQPDDSFAARTRVRVPTCGFAGHAGEREAVDLARLRDYDAAFTFADAVTVHKAQGSEWDSVLVVDETDTMRWTYRKSGETDPDAQVGRWLYTATTRAAQAVTFARRVV